MTPFSDQRSIPCHPPSHQFTLKGCSTSHHQGRSGGRCFYSIQVRPVSPSATAESLWPRPSPNSLNILRLAGPAHLPISFNSLSPAGPALLPSSLNNPSPCWAYPLPADGGNKSEAAEEAEHQRQLIGGGARQGKRLGNPGGHARSKVRCGDSGVISVCSFI